MLRVHTGERPAASGRRELAPRQSMHPLSALRDEMDRLFDAFWPDVGRWMASPLTAAMGETVPRADVTETGDAYAIEAELPGLDEQDVEVTFADGVLTVKGEKKEERVEEDAERNYYLSERRYGAFHRSFRIPEMVEDDKIEAKFDKGVLCVRLPKVRKAGPARKIEVGKAA